MRIQNFVIFLTIAFVSQTLYADVKFKIYSVKNKKYEVATFIKQKDFLISKDCVKKNVVKCEAWSATLKKANKIERKDINVAGHPAAQYCHAHGAENRVLIGKNNEQDDFCLFKDGSMIMAWSLYYAHHK